MKHKEALYMYWFIGSFTEKSNHILEYKKNTPIGLIILFLQNIQHYNSYQNHYETETLQGIQIVFLVTMATYAVG